MFYVLFIFIKYFYRKKVLQVFSLVFCTVPVLYIQHGTVVLRVRPTITTTGNNNLIATFLNFCVFKLVQSTESHIKTNMIKFLSLFSFGGSLPTTWWLVTGTNLRSRIQSTAWYQSTCSIGRRSILFNFVCHDEVLFRLQTNHNNKRKKV